MNWLRKRLQRERESWHLRDQLAQICEDFAAVQGVPVRVQHTGRVSGFDSIFRVVSRVSAATPVGMLRVNNPLRCQDVSDAGLPRIRLSGVDRIRREGIAYDRLSQRQLAPRVLMRGQSFQINEWLSHKRLSDVLRKDQQRIWQWLPVVLESTQQMHSAGISHMDLNPGNILVCESRRSAAFIDFEYTAPPTVDWPAQQAFDFIKLLANLLKPRRALRPFCSDPQRLLEMLEDMLPTGCCSTVLPFGFQHFPQLSASETIRSGLLKQFPGLAEDFPSAPFKGAA